MTDDGDNETTPKQNKEANKERQAKQNKGEQTPFEEAKPEGTTNNK